MSGIVAVKYEASDVWAFSLGYLPLKPFLFALLSLGEG